MLNTQTGSLSLKQLGTLGIICSMAKFDNAMNDYMVFMQAARRAKSEHKQEKHNSSYASKSGMS